ncbi:hypothetical protein KSP39_PZI022282 [Platanthera zijinensis]|uniref:Uncharacterized protein n=1 Tax=Platanthera zijinensis TaxID=2320716 RepID=A0AAP0FUP8_9ASPA
MWWLWWRSLEKPCGRRRLILVKEEAYIYGVKTIQVSYNNGHEIYLYLINCISKKSSGYMNGKMAKKESICANK